MKDNPKADPNGISNSFPSFFLKNIKYNIPVKEDKISKYKNTLNPVQTVNPAIKSISPVPKASMLLNFL